MSLSSDGVTLWESHWRLLLVNRGPGGDATVSICHSHTSNLKEVTQQADILIAAVGIPQLITADMVKPGAVVVDVGINRSSKRRNKPTVGDVDYEPVASLQKRYHQYRWSGAPYCRNASRKHILRLRRQNI